MLTRDPIEEVLAKHETMLRERLRLWTENRELFLPLVIGLKKLEVEMDIDGDLNVRFAGDKAKFTSVIRLLRTNHFETEESMPTAKTTYWSAWYRHPEATLAIWLSFSSTVCRTVKVGTKMVEQDVYEVQCD